MRDSLHRRFTSLRRPRLGVTSLTFAVACGGVTTSAPTRDDATRAAEGFARLADSVSRAGRDPDVGAAYASLAEAVRQGGRISPIVITVDGVPTTFLSTAQQTDVTLSCVTPQCSIAPSVNSLRTLMAWEQDDPRRVVQLSSAADADPIRAYLFPVLVPFRGPSASLIFFDGKGGTYFGASGTQKFGAMTSAAPCTAAGASRPVILIFPAPPRCTQADFSIAFTGKADPSTFLTGRNAATGSHSFTMSAQPVRGARFELTAPTLPRPPIVVTPSASLPATLSVKVDSLVALTLTVSNPSTMPASVQFTSGRHYDFTIIDAATGTWLWRWGMGVFFTQTLSTETIPANGTLEYTAVWKPTQRGNLIATGSLVSISHRADAKLAISLP